MADRLRAALSCAAPPGRPRLMPSAVAAAFNRIASAAFAERLAEAVAEAEADALAEAESAADAVAARLAPMPGIARFNPVKPFIMFRLDVSFSNSARAAAAGLSMAASMACRLGNWAFIEPAAIFRLATALALNGESPMPRLRLASASSLATAEADRFMLAAAEALRAAVALADADADALAEALADALAAALNWDRPAPVIRSGPSISMSMASGRFLSWAARAAS